MEFFVVYIREAHALDSAWPMPRPGAPLVEEPLRFEERLTVAATCAAKLELDPVPVLVDDIANSAERAYEAYPDRLLLVDREGRVAYRSGPGPIGFKPEELAAAIRAERAAPDGPVTAAVADR